MGLTEVAESKLEYESGAERNVVFVNDDDVLGSAQVASYRTIHSGEKDGYRTSYVVCFPKSPTKKGTKKIKQPTYTFYNILQLKSGDRFVGTLRKRHSSFT